ncbi:MAG: COX15/CtaA family protein [Actinobacteria bacterium]|nr:COX15/CtaA family protein [Actinomycetota bacterium]
MARHFRALALGAAASLYLIIITGALVRLTASGLGCESWPGCQEGSFFPAEDHHGFIEFGNRVFGAIPITLTLLAWIASRRAAGRFVSRIALATFLLTLVQAPIGLVVIVTDLEPIAVVVHFTLALLALAGSLVVLLESRAHDLGVAEATPGELRRAGLVLLGACLALVVSGTFATAAGPHSGDPDVDRLWVLEDAIWVHVRASGLFGLSLLFVLGYLFARRNRSRRLLRVGLLLAALALAQSAVGELQWQAELPWGIVLVHVALAAAVWSAAVVLVTLFYRPVEPQPLD